MPLSDTALLLALAVAAWNVGLGASRWQLAGGSARFAEAGLILAAMAALIGWGSAAGDLAAGAPPVSFVDQLPFRTTPLVRTAALWSTGTGAAISMATLLLSLAALWPAMGRGLRPQVVLRVAVLSSGVAGMLLAATVAGPGAGPASSTVPAWAQSTSALLATGALLLSATSALSAVLLALAARNAPQEGAGVPWNALALLSWVFATVALGAEQVARTRLGIGPQDPVVVGGPSATLVLWIASGAMLHDRVRRFFLPGLPVQPAPARGWGAMAAHAGSIALAASFAAHALASRTTLLLPAGTAVEVKDSFGRGWRAVNQGVSRFDEAGVDVTALAVELTDPAGRSRLVTAEIREPVPLGAAQVDPVGVRGRLRTSLQDARVLLESVDDDDAARVRLAFVPLALLWQAGLALVALSVGAMVLTRGLPSGASYQPE